MVPWYRGSVVAALYFVSAALFSLCFALELASPDRETSMLLVWLGLAIVWFGLGAAQLAKKKPPPEDA